MNAPSPLYLWEPGGSRVATTTVCIMPFGAGTLCMLRGSIVLPNLAHMRAKGIGIQASSSRAWCRPIVYLAGLASWCFLPKLFPTLMTKNWL